MKQIIQSFALGIFVATCILSVSYYLDSGYTKSEDTNLPTVEETIAQLESQGYIITHEQDQHTEDVESPDINDREETMSQKKTDESPKKKSSTNPETPELVTEEAITFVITIKPGMHSSEIVEQIYNAGLIDDEDAFRLFLEENGYNRSIQIGEYELNNTMTYKEIADIITN